MSSVFFTGRIGASGKGIMLGWNSD